VHGANPCSLMPPASSSTDGGGNGEYGESYRYNEIIDYKHSLDV